jgi:hypothetical protein
MHQALGGDALKAIETFSVKGSEERLVGRSTMHVSVEWAGMLPDRFIEVRRFPSSTITTGFNGDAALTVFEGGPGRGRSQLPVQPAEPTGAARRASVILQKQHFSRLTVGMFGITPVYPLDATYISRETLDGKPVHLLELRGPDDDYVARLCVDVTSHLPRMISWMGRPLTLGLSPLRATRTEPPMVEQRLYFSDYEKSDGLTWPHRIKAVEAKVIDVEIRLGKFRINSKVDPNRFDPKH